MTKKFIYTCLCALSITTLSAQEMAIEKDTIKHKSDALPNLSLGYHTSTDFENTTSSIQTVGRDVLEKSPEQDLMKALYGRFAGLNVYQGSGRPADNLATYSLHGHTPLILVDGYPRDASLIDISEVESVSVIKDATASALYGVQGANGVVLITTKRGYETKLKIHVDYQMGISTQFRKPEFSNAYTYARNQNTALISDGLVPRYNDLELAAFQSGDLPYAYPDINWWSEAYKKTGTNHQLKMSFVNGTDKLKFYTAVNYSHDRAMYGHSGLDSRYKNKPADAKLSVRTNIDAFITPTTVMKLGLMGQIREVNGIEDVKKLHEAVYRIPSAAFPIRYENGAFGGNSVYGNTNPVAMLGYSGNKKDFYGTLLADLAIEQDLNMITEGLSATVSVGFDNRGSMYDQAKLEYEYKDLRPSIDPQTGQLITSPVTYGKNAEIVDHSSSFSSLYMNTNLQAKVAYNRLFGDHHIDAALIYDQKAVTKNGRNKSTKNQSVLVNANYTFMDRYILSGTVNYSGSAYLEDGHRFSTYPAVSAAWIASKESFLSDIDMIDFLKVRASYGMSGWDKDMEHELFLQKYVGGGGYYFGPNVNDVWGLTEGDLPVIKLHAERSRKATIGFDLAMLKNRLQLSSEFFYEKRSNILVKAGNSISGIIGIDVSSQSTGINQYKGVDLALSLNDKIGDFKYGVSGNLSFIRTRIVNDNQAFQEYDYLYHKGNQISQVYGLEAIGFFQDEMEINNSPAQTFSNVKPGDVKYKDQNGDNVIDSKDFVKMSGTTDPELYYGFDINLEYKGIGLYAAFQGMAGATVNILESPLYKPLVDNGNISNTFLNRETPWTPENNMSATMPRLTTQANANNYQNSSLWYKNKSFLKLRNLELSYKIPRSLLKIADLKVYVRGTNLFSIDKIKFADPEQLAANYPSLRTYWAGVKFDF